MAANLPTESDAGRIDSPTPAKRDSAGLICGIDPGLGTGAIVALSPAGDRVLYARSLTEVRGDAARARERASELAGRLGGWGDRDYCAAHLRAEAWLARLRAACSELRDAHGPIRVCAVESFVDQRSRAREERARLLRNRWQVPHVIALVSVVLAEHGLTVENGGLVYQNAGTVLSQLSRELTLLRERGATEEERILAGDDLLTNDHERSAFAHALALSIRMAHRHEPDRGTHR